MSEYSFCGDICTFLKKKNLYICVAVATAMVIIGLGVGLGLLKSEQGNKCNRVTLWYFS